MTRRLYANEPRIPPTKISACFLRAAVTPSAIISAPVPNETIVAPTTPSPNPARLASRSAPSTRAGPPTDNATRPPIVSASNFQSGSFGRAGFPCSDAASFVSEFTVFAASMCWIALRSVRKRRTVYPMKIASKSTPSIRVTNPKKRKAIGKSETPVAITAWRRTFRSSTRGKMKAERPRARVTIVTLVPITLPTAKAGAPRPEASAAVSISSGSNPARMTPSTNALMPSERARSRTPSMNQSAPSKRRTVPTTSSPRSIKRDNTYVPSKRYFDHYYSSCCARRSIQKNPLHVGFL